MLSNRIYVINSEGEKEPFSFFKVFRSARRVGAPPVLARDVARMIAKEIHPGIKTSEIFSKIKKLLSQQKPESAIRFSLKEGMRRLGPTGFPFEKFIKEVLLSNGFEVKINRYIPGKCSVSYEIDFVAKRENLIYIGECKYHHLSGERVDLKVALSNYARFLDIKNGPYFREFQKSGFELKPILVTNTKFTGAVVKYARCYNTELLGWRYPKPMGLEYFIEKEKLYPITVLSSFRGHLKDIFAQNGMMLAKDLLKSSTSRLSQRLKLPEKSLLPLIKEAETLLK